jgi:hypothetical protein
VQVTGILGTHTFNKSKREAAECLNKMTAFFESPFGHLLIGTEDSKEEWEILTQEALNQKRCC